MRGRDAIRGVMQQFLALDATYEAETLQSFGNHELSLLISDWTVRGAGPGDPLELRGRTADVLRRQADGCWRYVIDAPYGGRQPPSP